MGMEDRGGLTDILSVSAVMGLLTFFKTKFLSSLVGFIMTTDGKYKTRLVKHCCFPAAQNTSNQDCLMMYHSLSRGSRYISVVRAFAHGAMGRRFDRSWWTH